ncbi:MAG: hypothetical protein AB7K09_00405 [Planctomycetota bacterium]
MTLPPTTRTHPASGTTTRLRFAWNGEAPPPRRSFRGMFAAVLIVASVAALLSLGRQLANAVDSPGSPDRARVQVTDATLPVLFGDSEAAVSSINVVTAGPANEAPLTSLISAQTVAVAQCDFFADCGSQPHVAVLDRAADGSHALRVFARDDDRWLLTFEFRAGADAGHFTGMTPRDLNHDGVPELSTWWTQPDGSFCTRLVCRTAGRLELVEAPPFALEVCVPPLEPPALCTHLGLDDLALNPELITADKETAAQAGLTAIPSR